MEPVARPRSLSHRDRVPVLEPDILVRIPVVLPRAEALPREQESRDLVQLQLNSGPEQLRREEAKEDLVQHEGDRPGAHLLEDQIRRVRTVARLQNLLTPSQKQILGKVW